jgi:hypothetical protein
LKVIKWSIFFCIIFNSVEVWLVVYTSRFVYV